MANKIPPPSPALIKGRVKLNIVNDVLVERDRQDALVKSGKFPWNCSDKRVAAGDKLMVLGEEFGEVSKAAYELTHETDSGCHKRHRDNLRTELVQLAAVAVAWIEAIDEEAK